MKTKEIEVWVTKNFGDTMQNNELVYIPTFSAPVGEGCYKAKLIVEIPELKIEITESEFDEAVKAAGNFDIDSYVYDVLKQKLFSK